MGQNSENILCVKIYNDPHVHDVSLPLILTRQNSWRETSIILKVDMETFINFDDKS